MQIIKKKTEPLPITQMIFTLFFAVLVFLILKSNTYSQTTNKAIIMCAVLLLLAGLLFPLSIYRILCSVPSRTFMLFLLYILLFSTRKYGIITTIGSLLSEITYFSGMFLFLLYQRRFSGKALLISVVLALLLWLVMDAQLIALCITNPDIGRSIASGDADTAISASIGYPYALVQGSCFISIVLVRLALDRRYDVPAVIRLLMLALAAGMIVAIYQVQSTITTLIAVGFCACAIVHNLVGRRDFKRNTRMFFLVVFGLLSFLILRGVIADVLIALFQGKRTVFAIRMVEIAELISGGNVFNDMAVRMELMIESWNGFLKSPLVGHYYLGSRIAGGHCGLLDLLSDFGLAGGIPYVFTFVAFYWYLKYCLRNFDFYIWGPVFLTSILNPLWLFQSYFAALFMVPALYTLFEAHIPEHS